MPAGRPSKPLKIHKLEGTLRSNRHGKGSKAMATATGAPELPNGLPEAGKRMWLFVVKRQRDYLAESDAESLRALCEVWALREKALWHVTRKPLDKDARCAFIAYHVEAMKLMGRFGLTPADRAHLGEVSPAEVDPAAEFIA